MNERDRHLLHELEHELEREDPVWVQQFTQAAPSRRTLNRLMLDTTLGLSVFIVAALGLLLQLPGAVVLFGMAAIILATLRFRR
ncbi:MAG TPA: DUF3040 domain-containing protein [Microlunatus sp.]|nr:DUF3040 domain-containing protein [Microlunatus sp.]